MLIGSISRLRGVFMEYSYKKSQSIWNLREYKLNNIREYAEMLIYSGICFFLPLFLGHPQIIVGVTVNAMLIASALNLRSAKLLPIIMLPSLGVLSRGLIFGSFSYYLVYMIPFIWIGNAILVAAFKWLKLKSGRGYWLTLALGTAAKSGFLFASAYALVSLGAIPPVFLVAMGGMQAYTALGGGAFAFFFQKMKSWADRR